MNYFLSIIHVRTKILFPVTEMYVNGAVCFRYTISVRPILFSITMTSRINSEKVDILEIPNDFADFLLKVQKDNKLIAWSDTSFNENRIAMIHFVNKNGN